VRSFAQLLGDLALHLAEQRIGGIASSLVFLRCHVGHLAEAEPAAPRVLRGDDRRGPWLVAVVVDRLRPFVPRRITGPCRFVGVGLTIAGTSSATVFRFRGGRL